MRGRSSGDGARPFVSWPVASLRSYLAIVILAATVPLAAFAFFLAQQQATAVRSQMHSLAQRNAAAFALNVERDLLAATNLLVGLSHSLALKSGDPAILRRALEYGAPLRAGLSGVDLLDAEGNVLYSTDPPTAYPQPRAAATLQQVRLTRQPAVTELLHSQYTGEWMTSVKVPVLADGTVRYVLSGHIPASHWQRLIGQASIAKGAFLSLVDANARVIAESGAGSGDIGRAVKIEETLKPQRSRWLDASVVAVQQVPPTAGWQVGAGFASPPLLGTQAGALALMFSAGAASLALGLVLAMKVAQRVAEPVAQLAQGGPPAVREPVVVSEIASLRSALHAAAEQRELAIQALQSKADEFEALFMGSPVGLALALDRTATHALINPALAALLGVEAGLHDMRALLGAEGESGLRVTQRGQPIALHEQPMQRASESGKSVEDVEIEVLHADGRRFDIAVHATPLRDESGKPRGAVAAFVDITDRKLVEHERVRLMLAEQQARRAAEAANRGKDEFLAILGHELRNPLSAICAAVEVLNRTPLEGAAAVSARAVLARKTRHMTQMMNDLQDVARVGAGKLELDRQTIDLAQLVWRPLDSMRLEGRFKQHAITLELRPAIVVADAMRMEQVVVNLLTNAVKYTPPGGHVQLLLRSRVEEVVLEVRDNGMGITSSFLPHVFELFAQSDQAAERRQGGMGLGLTLVRRLVELHGGSVDAQSEGTNRGSTFTLRLPRPAGALAEEPFLREGAAPLIASSRAVDELAIIGEAASWIGRHVVVVEADETLPFGIVRLLALAGCRVAAAPDALTALNVVIAAHPDAVLVDLTAPGVDAQALVDGVRAVGAKSALLGMIGTGEPVPLVTGLAAVLTKPVQPDDLRRHLQALPSKPALGA